MDVQEEENFYGLFFSFSFLGSLLFIFLSFSCCMPQGSTASHIYKEEISFRRSFLKELGNQERLTKKETHMDVQPFPS